MKLTLPDDYPAGDCLLVPVDRSLIPLVSAALSIFLERRTWAADSYEGGHRAFTEGLATMTALCVSDLVESNNRIYRLLDTALFGTTYEADDSDPPIITPGIPVVPATTISEPSMLFNSDAIIQLVDNTVNGTATPIYSYTPSVKELLQSIIDGVAAGDTTSDDLLSQLELIAALLA